MKKVIVFSALAFAVAIACSNYGEGDRCDTNEDCQSGLQCVQLASFSANTRVCCPGDPSRATPGSACATPLSLDAGPPTDAGQLSDGTSAEGASEASAGDSATDVGSDAVLDSTSDGSSSDVVLDGAGDSASSDAAGD